MGKGVAGVGARPPGAGGTAAGGVTGVWASGRGNSPDWGGIGAAARNGLPQRVQNLALSRFCD